MNMPDIHKTAINLRLPNELVVVVDKYARQFGASRSAIIVQVVKNRFKADLTLLNSKDMTVIKAMEMANLEKRKMQHKGSRK